MLLVKVQNSDLHATHRGANPYCPNHATGVRLPEGFAAVAPLEYVE